MCLLFVPVARRCIRFPKWPALGLKHTLPETKSLPRTQAKRPLKIEEGTTNAVVRANEKLQRKQASCSPPSRASSSSSSSSCRRMQLSWIKSPGTPGKLKTLGLQVQIAVLRLNFRAKENRLDERKLLHLSCLLSLPLRIRLLQVNLYLGTNRETLQ